eukprot:g27746.t1
MEQMGPLNYKIRGRGKMQIVNVRRLIKYDPFLLEDESVEEALKRMKEDFQEVPPIQKEDTLEEENAYRAPVTEKEETEKESKEDSNRKSAAGTQSKAPIVRGAKGVPRSSAGNLFPERLHHNDKGKVKLVGQRSTSQTTRHAIRETEIKVSWKVTPKI